ncbi:MAG: hypothetical protein ABIJ95_11955 [Pseudomonadota bacterium]
MAGVQGMKRTKSTNGTARRNVWRSMRILRRFTVPELCRTSKATRDNVWTYVRRLAAHGIVRQDGLFRGGRPGDCKNYRLVRDLGPEHPVCCEMCGRSLNKDGCGGKKEGGHE